MFWDKINKMFKILKEVFVIYQKLNFVFKNDKRLQ